MHIKHNGKYHSSLNRTIDYIYPHKVREKYSFNFLINNSIFNSPPGIKNLEYDMFLFSLFYVTGFIGRIKTEAQITTL